jgi:DNA repair protein RecN (Recombination protein N)
MLKSIYIKNFALLDELKVEFGTGFNVLTGETGAGKSIIIEAIGLLLGERATRDLVRLDSNQCVIEAEFYVNEGLGLISPLKENEIAELNGNTLIIRRIISSAGNSRQFINDIPVSVSVLKKVREAIVDIHSADEHQSLLKPEYQLQLLDEYAGVGSQKKEYEKIFIKCMTSGKELGELCKIGDEEARQQLEFLRGQIEEFKDETITAEDEKNLMEEHNLLSNIEEIHRLADDLINTFADGDFSITNNIARSKKTFEKLISLGLKKAADWQEDIEQIAGRVRELVKEISSKAFDNEFDMSRFKWVEERLALYYKFKRKFGNSIEEALENFQATKEKISLLEARTKKIEEKTKELEAIKEKLKESGKKLSNFRKNAAKKLDQGVLKNMKELALKNASFSINIYEENEPSSDGYDKIEFMFSANAGIEKEPLRDVASSGEISRAMLAIKSFLAGYDKTPVLLFDEIDVNIGGLTANVVAEKFQELAQTHQLICITHLPQVAAKAEHHFVVNKFVRDNKTFIVLNKVDGEKRVEEIARMLGSTRNVSSAIKHAEELLQPEVEHTHGKGISKSSKNDKK